MTFEIAGVDCTKWLQEGTYECKHDEDLDSWTDANKKRHFVTDTDRLKGSAELGFASENNEDYESFVQILNSAKIDHLIPVKMYVQDEAQDVETKMMITFSSVKQKELPSGYVVTVVKMKFEEA